MRRAEIVPIGLVVEPDGVDHQRIALVGPDRMTVVVRQGRQLLLAGHRLVHRDHAHLMVELMDDRDLARGALDGSRIQETAKF